MHLTAPTFQTERLTLRAMTPEDFTPFAALYTSARSRYINGPLSEDEARRDFTASIEQWPLLGYGTWAVDLRSSGAHIGLISISRPDIYPEDELGWVLYEPHEGRGYAQEAALRALDFAFGELGMASLVSYIDPGNRRSIQLAERLGAKRDPGAATPNGDPCLVYRHSNTSSA